MKVYPRRRIVTFRVTEEEYQTIKSTCDCYRNCVSEVARDAVLGSTGPPPHALDDRLACLDDKLDQVLGLLTRRNPDAPSKG